MLRFFFDLTGILVLVLVGSLLRSCSSHERGKYPKWIFIG